MANNIVRLRRIDPKDIWPHEAHDFTPWLADNLDSLSEILGMDLELLEQEGKARE